MRKIQFNKGKYHPYLKPFLVISALLLFISLTGRMSAQTQWQPTMGPTGGYIYSLLATDTFLITGTCGGGIFISTNSGASWQYSSSGITDLCVPSLAATTDTSGVTRFFAGTLSSGIFRSDDTCNTWAASNTGMGYVQVRAISVQYDIDGFPVLFAGTNAGVFRSLNNGLSWSALNSGITGQGSQDIYALAANDSFIMAGTGNGIFRLMAGDSTWTSVGLTGSQVYSLEAATDGLEGSVWFAGILFNGVYRSFNNGNNWSAYNTGLAYLNPVDFVSDSIDVYVGQYTGVYHTLSNGSLWSTLATTFNVHALAISENGLGGTAIYVGTDDNGGIFKSDNGGVTWQKSNTNLYATKISAMAAMPSTGMSPSILFVGMPGEAGGVQRSDDFGTTWSETGLGLFDVWSIHAIPDSAGGMILLAGGDPGTYRSLDSGQTWNYVHPYAILNFLLIPNSGGGTDLLMASIGGLYRSSNFGAGWSPYGSGLTGLITRDLVMVDSLMFLTTQSGVYYSNDMGLNWLPTGNSGITNTDTWDLVTIGQNLFISTAGGIFCSTNFGTNWYPANSGIGSTYIMDLIAVADTLFATTFNNVFRSDNLGGSWTTFGSGLAIKIMPCLLFVDSILFGGTNGLGAWKYPMHPIPTGFDSNLPDAAFAHGLVLHPNPTTGAFFISYRIPGKSPGNLIIADRLGRTLFEKRLKPGSTESHIDIPASIGNGIYEVIITSAGMKVSTKVVVIQRE